MVAENLPRLFTDSHALTNLGGTFKKMIGDKPLALDEFRKALGKEFKRVHMNLARFGAGTPTRKRVWANGRPRQVMVDGRLRHATKGFAKTERGGYAKRSRRSNTSRT